MLSRSNALTSGYVSGNGSDQPAVSANPSKKKIGRNKPSIDDSTRVHTERCPRSRRSDRLYEPLCNGQTPIGNNRRMRHDPVNHIVTVPRGALSDGDRIRFIVSGFARSGSTP
jgi:hypothetical protein